MNILLSFLKMFTSLFLVFVIIITAIILLNLIKSINRKESIEITYNFPWSNIKK